MDKELKDALDKVIYYQYARAYAKAAIRNPHTATEMSGHELAVQLLYVLNNLQSWRGEEARATKLILKKWAKELDNRKHYDSESTVNWDEHGDNYGDR